MIVAIIALIVAASGSALAATIITGANIKNGSVTGLDIKNGSLTGTDVKNSSLGTADLSATARAALKGQAGAQGPAGPSGTQSAWGASTYQNISLAQNSGGPVAHLTFTSPSAGFVVLRAQFAVRVRNNFDTTAVDCRVRSQIAGLPAAPDPAIGPTATSAPGFIDQWVNGNLPTQNGAGTFLGLNQSGSRILPVVAGVNNIYLNGFNGCPGAIWGPITMTAELVQENPAATIAAN
jgi:hypothetical protein